MKFGIKAGRRESDREKEKGDVGGIGGRVGDKIRTFHKEAAVAPPQ